jgi:hypothetical protein
MGMGPGNGVDLFWSRHKSGGVFTPLSLFAMGEAGAWYDPSDLSTMFQFGTQPVAVNAPVSTMLDKSQGLALGTQFTPANFVDPTVTWDVFTPSAGGFSATKSTAGGNDTAYTTDTVAVTLGKWYRVEVDISANTIPSLNIQFSVTTNSRSTVGTPAANQTGTVVCYLLANIASGNFSVSIGTSSLGSITVDAVRVREIAGNHLNQSTFAARPILRGTPTGSTLLTNGDWAANDTGWTVAGGTTSYSGTAPNRVVTLTNVASRVTLSQAFTTVVGRVYRAICPAANNLTSGTTAATLRVTSTNSFGGTLLGQAAAFNAGDNYLEVYFTATSTTSYIWVANNSTTAALTVSFGSVEIKDVSADAVAAPYFLQNDGVDDSLSSGTSPEWTNEFEFWAAVRFATGAGIGQLLFAKTTAGASSSSANTQGMFQRSDVVQRIIAVARIGGGAANFVEVNSAYVIGGAPVTARVNKTAAPELRVTSNGNTDTMVPTNTGTPATTPFTLFTNSATAQTPMYGAVAIERALTTDEADNLKAYLDAKAGL